MRRVNEIFYSLQGEGANTGVPATFIRLSGCNLKCPFCDTHHNDGVMMSDDQIIEAVRQYNAPLIVITGGEPSLHIDVDFVEKLKQATSARIAIETNGTHPIPDNIDWVTVSPKTGISDTTVDLPIVVDRADEIKVVDLGQPLNQYFSLECYRPETLMYLQPCYVNNPEPALANRRRTVQRVLDDPRWRLSLQTHRLLDIP